MEVADKKNIYIVISQSGSFPSRFLKLFTRAKYNHISISLDKNCDEMYSFGRKYAYYPFWGGFVCESVKFGLFKRFPNSKIIVLKTEIDEDKFENLSKKILTMKQEKDKYSYNYFGLLLAIFKKEHRFKNKFYCSEFIKYILEDFKVLNSSDLTEVFQPIHFLNLPFERIYSGTLMEYTNQTL